MDTAVKDFLNELRPRVAGDLRDDDYTRTLYSTDASLYQVMPHAVLIPRHADDMQAAGPVRLSVVEKAQADLVLVAMDLAQKDRITIVRPADKMV